MLPGHARVVIVGGGIIGTSVAYHLAKLGWTDVVLCEQGSLSGGTGLRTLAKGPPRRPRSPRPDATRPDCER